MLIAALNGCQGESLAQGPVDPSAQTDPPPAPAPGSRRAVQAPRGAPYQDVQQEQQQGCGSAIRPQAGGDDPAVPPWREDLLRTGREHPASLLAQGTQERQVCRQQAKFVRVRIKQPAAAGSRDVGRAQSRNGQQIKAPGYVARGGERDASAIAARRDLTQCSDRTLPVWRRDAHIRPESVAKAAVVAEPGEIDECFAPFASDLPVEAFTAVAPGAVAHDLCP